MREDLMILDEINKQLSQMTESEINELNEKIENDVIQETPMFDLLYENLINENINIDNNSEMNEYLMVTKCKNTMFFGHENEAKK